MFMRLIYWKNSTFLSLKIIGDTLIDVRNETSKHHSLKSVKINTKPCFPMRMFQSVSKHSSAQSVAHYSSQPVVLQLKGVSDTISNWLENHKPQRTQIPPSLTLLSFKNRIEWPPGWLQPYDFRAYFLNSCNIQGNVQASRLTGLLG